MWYSAVGYLVTLTLSLLVAPLTAVAQPAEQVPQIGVLVPGAATPVFVQNFEAFTQGLRALGYIEGQNIVITQRFAEGRPERLPALAAELATLPVAVFVVNINSVAAAVQQTT
jgi:putative ABC transport system substrate-binding protein